MSGRQKINQTVLIQLDEKAVPQVQDYTVVKKNWGAEYWIVNCHLYCMKVLVLAKGRMCSIHYHREKDETFYISDGLVRLELWHNVDVAMFDQHRPTNVMTLWQGASIRIPPRTAHRFYGEKHSSLIEVSTMHREEDSVRLVPAP